MDDRIKSIDVHATMKSDTTDTNSAKAITELTSPDIFRLLSDARRLSTMHYLNNRVGAIPIDDLAEQLALNEGDLSGDHIERILTGLYHNHLPALRDADLIAYDVEAERIERLSAADQLTPYLNLATTTGKQ